MSCPTRDLIGSLYGTKTSKLIFFILPILVKIAVVPAFLPMSYPAIRPKSNDPDR
jgi:hypothetical protein